MSTSSASLPLIPLFSPSLTPSIASLEDPRDHNLKDRTSVLVFDKGPASATRVGGDLSQTDKVTQQIRILAVSSQKKSEEEKKKGLDSLSSTYKALILLTYSNKRSLDILAQKVVQAFQNESSLKDSKKHDHIPSAGIEIERKIHAFKDAKTCRVYIPTDIVPLPPSSIQLGTFKKLGVALKILFDIKQTAWIPRKAELCARLESNFPNSLKAQTDFLASFDILKKFDDPRILKVFDHGWVNREVVAYTPLYEEDLFFRAPRLDSEQKLPIYLNMAQCVETAHKKNRPHFDIKPANFLIAQGKFLCLTDFLENQVATSYLRPPEQQVIFMGQSRLGPAAQQLFLGKVDKSADIWSLAVSFYEMEWGAPPWAPLFAFLEQPPLYNHLAKETRFSAMSGQKEKLSPAAQKIKERVEEEKKKIDGLRAEELAKLHFSPPPTPCSFQSNSKKETPTPYTYTDFLEYFDKQGAADPLPMNSQEVKASLTALIDAINFKIFETLKKVRQVNQPTSLFSQLIIDMLAFNPTERPTIGEVVTRLTRINEAKKIAFMAKFQNAKHSRS